MGLDRFAYPLGVIVQGRCIEGFAVAQVGDLRHQLELFEQLDPVGHRRRRAARPGAQLAQPQRTSVQQAAEKVEASLVGDDRLQGGAQITTPPGYPDRSWEVKRPGHARGNAIIPPWP